MRTNAFLILSAVLGGCGGGSSAVYLTVDSVAPVSGVDHLRVAVMNNGMTSMATDIPLTGRPVAIPPAVHVQIRLEGGRSGVASIQVDAADAGGKVLASGTATADLQVGREVEARVVLGGGVPGDGGIDGPPADLANPPDLAPAVSFLPTTPIPVGKRPTGVFAGDFDRNGKIDLAVTNVGDGSISLLMGNGDGTFRSIGNQAVGTSPIVAAVVDVNRDQRADIAVCGVNPGTFWLAGDGAGSFTAKSTLAPGTCHAIAPIDLNHDGNPDLVVGSQFNKVQVLIGGGNGAFAASIDTAVPGLQFFAIGELNGDGKEDLVASYFSNSPAGGHLVLLGDGVGAFRPSGTNIAASELLGPPFLVDANKDDRQDLITPNAEARGFSVRLGVGDGSFLPAKDHTVGDIASVFGAIDLDHDGRIDLIGQTRRTIFVAFGRGNGTFSDGIQWTAADMTLGIPAIRDFNGDGKVDIATASLNEGKVNVFLNTSR